IDNAELIAPAKMLRQETGEFAITRAVVDRLAQPQPFRRKTGHWDVALMTSAMIRAVSHHCGSVWPCVQAASASPRRKAQSPMRRPRASLRALTSSGGTRIPALAGTVAGTAPALAATTGKPCARASAKAMP